MIRLAIQLGLAGLLLVAAFSTSTVHAQDKDLDLDEFRRLRRLEVPLDFWNAVQFELDLGKPDIAARYLRGLLDKKPTDKDLLTILDKDGMTTILKLRNIRFWTRDKKENDQAIKDAETLIQMVTKANATRLADGTRIRELIAQLRGSPEERMYATRELYKIGPIAVPYFIEGYQATKDSDERQAILQVLSKMGADTIPPMLAALDSNFTALKLDFLDILRKHHARYSKEIVPFLWYISTAKGESTLVRKKATDILSDFLGLPATRLPLAKAALTREAEKYYQHEVSFGDPRAVVIWRWDGNRVVQGWPGTPTVTASQAEEYFGQKFARQALLLDPTYRPAQLVSLSLLVDKAMEKAGPAAALSRTSPEVAELLARANPDLIIEMLDRAMKEKRSNVALAAVRTLGERAEVRSRTPLRGSEPALLRALYYQDPRVQFAAAVALLNIPGTPQPKTATRIVEILARALSRTTAYRPGRKILVALTDGGLRNRVQQYVVDAGAEPIVVNNGRDAMRRLREHANIEAILLDSTLPHPGLANLLAQMRQDVDVGSIPILLAAIPESRTSLDATHRYNHILERVKEIRRVTSQYRALIRDLDRKEEEEKKELERDLARERRVNPEQRELGYRGIEAKYNAQRQQFAREFPDSKDLLDKLPELEKRMAREVERYDLESQIRENALERFVRRYQNVKVIHASLLTDASKLGTIVTTQLTESGIELTAAEQRSAADQAMELLANLIEGNPPGYDVRPAKTAILNALRGGTLSLEAQKAGIRAAVRLDGPETQQVLAYLVKDSMRNIELRLAASKSLIVLVQRQGLLLSGAELASLQAMANQAGLDARLKDQLHLLAGAVRATQEKTGERLRDYRPTPVPVIPPPPVPKP